MHRTRLAVSALAALLLAGCSPTFAIGPSVWGSPMPGLGVGVDSYSTGCSAGWYGLQPGPLGGAVQNPYAPFGMQRTIGQLQARYSILSDPAPREAGWKRAVTAGC